MDHAGPVTMRRVLVAGNTGAGKTTTGRILAGKLGVPFHEIDELAFRPGWQANPVYPGVVLRVAEEPAWVLDTWGDPRIRAELWNRADTVIWLDYPLSVILPRLFRRSAKRTITHEEIFNGNIESYAEWLSRDHPLRSAVRDQRPRRAAMIRMIALNPHLVAVRLSSPAVTDRWLAELGP
jgi:adenylate kinase family enzyme